MRPGETAGAKKNALNGSASRRSRVGIRDISPLIFCRADARAEGAPIRIAPERSAESSRYRESARISRYDRKYTTALTSRISRNTAAPFLSPRFRRPPPIPPYSPTRVSMPARTPRKDATVITVTSRWATCESSWARTASNSAGVSRWRSPVVTQTSARLGDPAGRERVRHVRVGHRHPRLRHVRERAEPVDHRVQFGRLGRRDLSPVHGVERHPVGEEPLGEQHHAGDDHDGDPARRRDTGRTPRSRRRAGRAGT